MSQWQSFSGCPIMYLMKKARSWSLWASGFTPADVLEFSLGTVFWFVAPVRDWLSADGWTRFIVQQSSAFSNFNGFERTHLCGISKSIVNIGSLHHRSPTRVLLRPQFVAKQGFSRVYQKWRQNSKIREWETHKKGTENFFVIVKWSLGTGLHHRT